MRQEMINNLGPSQTTEQTGRLLIGKLVSCVREDFNSLWCILCGILQLSKGIHLVKFGILAVYDAKNAAKD